MELLSLTVACPSCGSHDVVYTCEPKCCFNHVCNACYASFELFTREVGKEVMSFDIPTEERDSCLPTVACARCEGLDIYLVRSDEVLDGKLVCSSCYALLELGFTSVDAR